MCMGTQRYNHCAPLSDVVLLSPLSHRDQPGSRNRNSITTPVTSCRAYVLLHLAITATATTAATATAKIQATFKGEKAALSDGAHRRYDCFPDSEAPRWLMALVIWPGYDFHWYRKHKEGFWGHKPGGTAAKNLDNSNQIIYNPEKCNRGGYTQFCGYFYACRSMKIK